MEEKIREELFAEMILPAKRYQKPFIITMSGHCGSGKSYISKLLSRELSVYIISGDRIRDKILSINSNFDPQELYNMKNRINIYIIKKLLENNVSIVMDRSVSSMEQLNLVKQLTNNAITIKLLSDDDTNKKRVVSRDKINPVIMPIYGDYESPSDILTIEAYDEVKSRKIYDIPDILFNYEIDTTKSLEEVEEQVIKISKQIKSKAE